MDRGLPVGQMAVGMAEERDRVEWRGMLQEQNKAEGHGSDTCTHGATTPRNGESPLPPGCPNVSSVSLLCAAFYLHAQERVGGPCLCAHEAASVVLRTDLRIEEVPAQSQIENK